MKFAASVSLAALALAGCAANTASTAPVADVPASAAAPAADGLPHPLTADGAAQFIAAVEKDLFDFSVISQPRAVGQRDLHQRRHRRARRLFRHDRHREGRQICHRGGAIFARFRASTPTPRASSTSCAARSSCRRRPRPARRPSSTTSPPRCSRPTARAAARKRQADHRRRHRSADGRRFAIRPSSSEMWKSWHDNVGRADAQDYARMVEIANQGAKELGYRRHRRDVALAIRHDARGIRGDVPTGCGAR